MSIQLDPAEPVENAPAHAMVVKLVDEEGSIKDSKVLKLSVRESLKKQMGDPDLQEIYSLKLVGANGCLERQN